MPREGETRMTPREFTRRENDVLGRFLDVPHLVGWQRTYQCGCGYWTHAPGELYEHILAHGEEVR